MKNHIHIFFVFLLTIVFGCSSSNTVHRGKLSGAMDAASDDNKGERKVEIAEPEPLRHDDASESGRTEFHDSDSGTTTGVYSQSSIKSGWFGFDIGSGILNENDFYGLSTFSLHYGGYMSESAWIQFHAGLNFSPVQQTSALSKSIQDGVLLLEAGASYRFFTTPSYTFLGHYLIGGCGIEFMTWNYKNSFTVPDVDSYGNSIGTTTITNDNLVGFDLHIGSGINIAQFSRLRIGGEVTPGVIIWGFRTGEGFDNDIFGPFAYVKFNITVNFGVGKEEN